MACNSDYTFCNPLDFQHLDYGQRHKSSGETGIYLEPPGLPRLYERTPPLFHDDPDNAGIFNVLNGCRVHYPATFVLFARNVKLVGYRTILTMDRQFTSDQGFVDADPRRVRYLNDLSYHNNPRPEQHELAGLTRLSAGHEIFSFDELARPHIDLKGTVVVLCSHEPPNYGSFLFRVLPKLTLVEASEEARFLVYCEHASMREFLALFGVAEDRIIRHNPRAIYQIDRAIIPCLRNPDALLDEKSLEFYASARNRFGTSSQDRKIYVSRQSWRKGLMARVMINEAMLIDRLRDLDFDIVEPENLSAEEQVRIFSSAKLVVGPQGSGMFNVVFCHPGTHVVDIESAPNWIHAHMCLFGSCQMRYGIFEARQVSDGNDASPHQPFDVNVDALVERLNSLS